MFCDYDVGRQGLVWTCVGVESLSHGTDVDVVEAGDGT